MPNPKYDEVKEWFDFDSRSHWDDHPDFHVEDWQYEVRNGDTRLGYKDWCLHQADQWDVDNGN